MFWETVLLLLSILIQESPQTLRLTGAPSPRVPLETVETGLVVLEGEVDSGGKTGGIQVLQGEPPFIEPSVEAVRQWTTERPPAELQWL